MVRPFKTVFGSEVKAVTLIVGASKVSLLDAEGHVLTEFIIPENSTLPAFEPDQIVRPSHMNDQMFGVISKSGRLDGFRVIIDESDRLRKNITVNLDWSIAFAAHNITGPIKAHSMSR